jgi:hypothetical protein
MLSQFWLHGKSHLLALTKTSNVTVQVQQGNAICDHERARYACARGKHSIHARVSTPSRLDEEERIFLGATPIGPRPEVH